MAKTALEYIMFLKQNNLFASACVSRLHKSFVVYVNSWARACVFPGIRFFFLLSFIFSMLFFFNLKTINISVNLVRILHLNGFDVSNSVLCSLFTCWCRIFLYKSFANGIRVVINV